MNETPVLLDVKNLKVAYGGIQAVKGVSFEVHEGELVTLIGANGAGKTTTLKAVTGLQPVLSGEVHYQGRSLRGQGPWDLVRQGLVMVPEGRGTFTRMTITENLLMGAYIRDDKAQIEADIERTGRPPADLTVDEMNALAAKYGVQHIYFIDRAHRVFNTNLAYDKGITFPRGGFSDFLDSVFDKGRAMSDGVDLSSVTGTLRTCSSVTMRQTCTGTFSVTCSSTQRSVWVGTRRACTCGT